MTVVVIVIIHKNEQIKKMITIIICSKMILSKILYFLTLSMKICEV